MRFLIIICLMSYVGSARADRWIVKNAIRNQDSLKRLGFRSVKELHFKNTYTVITNDKKNQDARELDLLQENFGTKEIYPDFPIGLETTPQVSAAAVEESWHVDKMNYSAFENKFTGEGIVVAVLDTGVDTQHSALKNHIWINKKEIPGNGIDDDGNGYIDDVTGFSFNTHTGKVTDTNSHGTHCAGIIAADPQKKDGVKVARGVARGVKIMPVQVITGKSDAFLSEAAEGIKYAVDNGAQILSNSWRLYESWSQFKPTEANLALLREAIRYAGDKKVIFVGAAGNERGNIDLHTNTIYPLGFEGLWNMIGVAASEHQDFVASFSNYGINNVHVAAPGDKIFSTFPKEKWSNNSGTSMAAPLVAGVLALGLQAGYTAEEAKQKLIFTSDNFDAWKGKNTAEGIVNIPHFLGM